MNRTIHTVIIRAALGAAAFALLGAPSCGHVLEDEGFDLWCGDQLCAWQVDDGEIAKVPTWHEADYGVELLGPSVAISQRAYTSAGCIRFEAVADVDELADVRLQIDFYDDGTVDYEERIPTSSWEPVSFLITAPEIYTGARFRVRKLGNGHAALAQIEATVADKCVDPPVDLGLYQDGMYCVDGGQCDGGACASAGTGWWPSCAECSGDADCGGQVCGVEATVPRFYQPFLACVAPASHAIGELCHGDAECSSGHCAGVCTACAGAADCGGGESCEPITGGDYDALAVRPSLCAAGGQVASGGACLVDGQCASASCSGGGDLRVCLADGRLCAGDADCGPDATDTTARDGHCVSLGVYDGHCD